MAIVISNKQSIVGPPTAYYSLSLTEKSRTATTVTYNYVVSGKLGGSSQWVGSGYIFTATVYVGSNSSSVILKNKTTTWEGTATHSVSGTITVNCSATTTSLSTALKVDNNIDTACELAKYSGSNISASLYATASTITTDKTEYTIGETITYTINNNISGLTHNVYFYLGDWSQHTDGIQDGSTLNTNNYYSTLCEEIPNSTSASLKITCYTYKGSTYIGSTNKYVTLKIPTSATPTFTYTVAEAVNDLDTQFGAYVRGKSKAKVTISASGAYGSTIKSYSISIGTQTFGTSSATSSTLTEETVAIQMIVTDSRNRTITKSTTITTIDYSNPTTSLSVQRCTADGTISNNGTFVKMTYSYNIAPVGDKNTKSCAIQCLSGAEWTTIETLTDYSGNASIVKGTYSADLPYKFRIVATDYFTNSTSNADLSTAFTLINFNASGNGVCFGGVSQDDTFEVNLSANFTNALKKNGEEVIAGVVEIAEGGTGATTVEGALINLGISTENKILWSGAQYMSDDETITLTEAVSAQQTGICLVFSPYRSEEAKNFDFQDFFISKKIIELFPRKGHDFFMCISPGGSIGQKYLYISDTSITGYSKNDQTFTGTNGIKFTNNDFVLRYVIGV